MKGSLTEAAVVKYRGNGAHFLASLWKVTEVVRNSDVVLKFERVPESIKQTQMKTQTVCLSF